MDAGTIIHICTIAFILGTVFAMLLDKSLLHFRFNSGYRQAVQDILRDHIYKDMEGYWHQLYFTTWRDVTPHEDSQKKQTI